MQWKDKPIPYTELDMDIRRVQDHDVRPLLDELWKPFAEEMERYGEYNALAEDARERIRRQFEDWREEEEAVVLVAEVDDQLAGYAVGEVRESGEFQRGPEFYVIHTYVRDRTREQGVGSKLFEAIETRARNRGCETIALQVHLENEAANQLYEQMGLEKTRYLRTKFID